MPHLPPAVLTVQVQTSLSADGFEDSIFGWVKLVPLMDHNDQPSVGSQHANDTEPSETRCVTVMLVWSDVVNGC